MKTSTFVVEGVFPFPIDMLRYDQCFPVTGNDAAEIEASINRERDAEGKRRKFSVKLTTVSHAGLYPTTARWESFGWKVVP